MTVHWHAAVMKVQFISSVSVIARDPAASRPLFLQTFGLPLEPVAGTDGLHDRAPSPGTLYRSSTLAFE
jgi:hypothetical protein